MYVLVCIGVIGVSLGAQSSGGATSVLVANQQRGDSLNLVEVGQVKPTTPTMPVQLKDYERGWFTEDQNQDGKVDYAFSVDKKAKKVSEAYDFNNDGSMDDFYLYQDGVLAVREIDSNFDGKIDLWVYLFKGAYVRGYEKDKDFDGIIDYVKRY